MKILMIGPVPEPFTGQSISFKKLKDELSSDSRFEVFHADTSPRINNKHVTGKISHFRAFETLKLLVVCFYYFLKIKPDVIYLTKGSTTFGFLRDFFLMMLKTIFCREAKFVLHLKGGNYDSFYYSSSVVVRFLIRIFLKKADDIIVLGNSLVKMYDFIPDVAYKISVIENALTFDVLPCDLVSNIENEVTFIFLSNLIISKGYLDVAEAADCLNKTGCSNFRLVFAGAFMESPDDPDDLISRQESFLKLVDDNSNIEYVGSISGLDKSNLLISADVLLLPTHYHVEGQPNCIIEAMAYSCAIISTNYRSIPDLIDETNSFFVDYNDVNQIAEKMSYLINHRNTLEEMGRNSNVIYNLKFSWSTHYKKILKVFCG